MNDTEFLSRLGEQLESVSSVSDACILAIRNEAVRQVRRRFFRRVIGSSVAIAASIVIFLTGFMLSRKTIVMNETVPIEAVLAVLGVAENHPEVGLCVNATEAVLTWQDVPYTTLCEEVESQVVEL